MKLRYYLRGLGIGMLVAALVLILSGNTGGRMSDEAVKSRAAQLGMVEKDKSVLDDIEKEDNSEMEANETGQDAESEAAVVDGAQTSEENEGSETEPVMQDEENIPVQGEEQTLAEEIEQKAEEVAETAEEVAENYIP